MKFFELIIWIVLILGGSFICFVEGFGGNVCYFFGCFLFKFGCDFLGGEEVCVGNEG